MSKVDINQDIDRITKMMGEKPEDLTAYRYYVDRNHHIRKRNWVARGAELITRALTFTNKGKREMREEDAIRIQSFVNAVVDQTDPGTFDRVMSFIRGGPEVNLKVDGVVVDNALLIQMIKQIKTYMPEPHAIQSDKISKLALLSFQLEKASLNHEDTFGSTIQADIDKFFKHLETDPKGLKAQLLKRSEVENGQIPLDEVVLLAKSADYYRKISTGSTSHGQKQLNKLSDLFNNAHLYFQTQIGKSEHYFESSKKTDTQLEKTQESLFNILVSDGPISSLYENSSNFSNVTHVTNDRLDELIKHAEKICNYLKTNKLDDAFTKETKLAPIYDKLKMLYKEKLNREESNILNASKGTNPKHPQDARLIVKYKLIQSLPDPIAKELLGLNGKVIQFNRIKMIVAVDSLKTVEEKYAKLSELFSTIQGKELQDILKVSDVDFRNIKDRYESATEAVMFLKGVSDVRESHLSSSRYDSFSHQMIVDHTKAVNSSMEDISKFKLLLPGMNETRDYMVDYHGWLKGNASTNGLETFIVEATKALSSPQDLNNEVVSGHITRLKVQWNKKPEHNARVPIEVKERYDNTIEKLEKVIESLTKVNFDQEFKKFIEGSLGLPNFKDILPKDVPALLQKLSSLNGLKKNINTEAGKYHKDLASDSEYTSAAEKLDNLLEKYTDNYKNKVGVIKTGFERINQNLNKKLTGPEVLRDFFKLESDISMLVNVLPRVEYERYKTELDILALKLLPQRLQALTEAVENSPEEAEKHLEMLATLRGNLRTRHTYVANLTSEEKAALKPLDRSIMTLEASIKKGTQISVASIQNFIAQITKLEEDVNESLNANRRLTGVFTLSSRKAQNICQTLAKKLKSNEDYVANYPENFENNKALKEMLTRVRGVSPAGRRLKKLALTLGSANF